LVYSIIISVLLIFTPVTIDAGGKMYQPKSDKKIYGKKNEYSRSQKLNQGITKNPKMVTCMLKKRLKAKNGDEVCIYQGQNRTYEMAIEKNCPRKYKCLYNPYGEEPNIYSVIDSLNESAK
jgi:hypothetical protein